MTTNILSGIVRVVSGKYIGSGFVVSANGLIVTCAHVLGPSMPKQARVVFQATGEERGAVVIGEAWRAVDEEDVAVLSVGGTLPEGVHALPLGSSQGTEGHPMITFGYPETGEVEGIRATGIILGRGARTRAGQPLLQLRSSEITVGFSGAPIWDEVRRRVIGMVVIAAESDELGKLSETAFAIPSETLRVVCPALEVSDICPYLGLDAFTEAHAEFFCGRQQVIDRLVNRLKYDPRFLCVLGPSGSGKSSIVQAGLIPRLRQGALVSSEHWGVIITRPHDDPFNQLAVRGFAVELQDLTTGVRAWFDQHPEQTRLVLVFDQFEELLILCPEAVRRNFVTQLTHLLEGSLPISVILVMRDDFYNQLVQQEALRDWLERSQGPINVPQTLKWHELVTIVKEPAEAVGLRFETGLVETIVKDALEATALAEEEEWVARSTILPLLEFALTQLWERRKDGMLTRDVYNTIGGVRGGLTQWADQAFYGLENEEKRRKARRIFTDLVYISDESHELSDNLRRRSLSSLCRSGSELGEVHQVVQRLSDARLLVTAQDLQSKQEIVEIIHEALLREWRLLRQWLEEDRRFLVWHQELEKRVRAWIETSLGDTSQRDKDRLLRGSVLKEAEGWRAERSTELSQAEHDFIQASREQQEQEEQLRKRYARRTFLVALGGLGLAATVGGITWKVLPRGSGIASPTPRPTATLIMQKIPLLTYSGHSNTVNTVAWSPDGRRIASGSDDKSVRVWDASTKKTFLTYQQHTKDVNSAFWSHDGKRIASASADRTARVWEASTGNTLVTYQHDIDEVRDAAWSPDDKRIASGSWDRIVRVWDATTGLTYVTYTGHQFSVNAAAWSPDSTLIASAGGDSVLVWDVSTGGGNISYVYRGHTNVVRDIAWSPDGRRIASASDDGTVQVWDATTGGHIDAYYTYSNSGVLTSVLAVAWSPNGKLIASANWDHTAHVWDPATGNILRIYAGHSNTVNDVAWSPDSKRIATASDDMLVLVWQVP